MNKILLPTFLLCVFSFLSQLTEAQTDDEMIATLKEQVSRVSSSVDFNIDSFTKADEGVARDNYSFTLNGHGTFTGIPNVTFLAYFNKEGKPNYFRASLPDATTPGMLNMDALAASNSLQQFFLPALFEQKIMLSSWAVEFNTAKNQVSKLTLKFRIAGQFTPIEDWDMSLTEVAVGYEIENPLAPAKNPADTNYQKKMSALLSATMNVFGAEVNLSSNLATKMEDWKISADIYDIKIPLGTIWEKMKGDKIMPWPSFMNEFNVSKLQIDLNPVSELHITAWTDLGNFNFIVKRSLEDKPAPLSTMLAGDYGAKTTAGNSSSLNTQLTGAYTTQASSNTTTNTNGGSSSTPEKKSVYEILAAYSLPENKQFGGPLSILNCFQPSNAGIVISTFKDPMDNTLPIFAGMEKGDTKVPPGVTFMALVDINNLKQDNLKSYLKKITKFCEVNSPLTSVFFRATVPLPPQPLQNTTASAALNFSNKVNFFNRVYFKNLTLEARPATGDPEFSLYGTMDVVLNDPKSPLTFKGGLGILPASLTAVGKGQMEGILTWPHPYGFPKVSFSNLALTAGIKMDGEIPTPDNIFLSGQMLVNGIAGNATIGLDQNNIGRDMIVARFCNLDFNSLVNAFCGPAIVEKVPNHIRRMIGNTGIKNVYVKIVPPGATPAFIGGYPPEDPGFTENCYPIPTVKENDFSPGYKLAGQAQLLNWDGNFVFGFEGDMTGLSAGLTAVASMSPVKVPVKIGDIPVFELTGAGGNGRPELFIDLSTRHLISGITNKFSPLRSETETNFVNSKECFIQARHSGRVIDIEGASKQMEATVQQDDLNRSGSQQFIFEPAADGYYSIKNVNSGMYLDVHMGLAEPGRKIWQYLGNGSPAQLFQPIMNNDGYFELQSKLDPNLVVEVADAGITNGTILRINTRKQGSYNQQFRQLMANMAADPSTETGYRENQVIYGSGQITILGVTANAYLDFNTDGFECNLNGNILGFLKGNIQAAIADFENPLVGTSVSGSVDQDVVEIIQDKAKDAIKTVFGSRMANVFVSISSKLLDIRSITFSGNLDAFKSGVGMDVKYAVAGKEDVVEVNVDVNDVGRFAENIGKDIASKSKSRFELLMGEAEQLNQVWEAIEPKLTGIATSALSTANQLKDDGLKTAAELKNKLTGAAGTTYKATKDAFESAGRKTEQFAKDFASFTKSTVEKIYNKTYSLVTNGFDDFSKDVKKLFTGADNEELVMYNGPGFRIITKFSNQVIKAGASRIKDLPARLGLRQNSPEEVWQLTKNDVEGSFYMVSAYNGLLMTNGLRTGLHVSRILIRPHESDHKDRERLVMEPVPNAPGWYYIKYSADNYYLVLRNGILIPSPTKDNTDYGKFRFEKAADIDWERTKKTKSFPPDMVPAIPLVEGNRYQFNGEPEQYVFSNGTFRWIPGTETLIGAKLDARPLSILPNSQQVGAILGSPLPSRRDGTLIQAQNEPDVFIMDGGMRRRIPDTETFNMLGLNTGMIQVISKQDLLSIPPGQQLLSKFAPKIELQERVMYQVPGDPAVYIVINKMLRHILDPETIFAMGYKWEMVQYISAEELNTLPKGADLPSRKDGTLLRAGNEPQVFIMEKGMRRWILDMETFNFMKLNMANVISVASQDFLDIPEGPNVLSVK